MHKQSTQQLAPWRQRVLRINLILCVAMSSFQLGRLSESFSGRPAAWATLILAILVILLAIWHSWRWPHPIGDRQVARTQSQSCDSDHTLSPTT